MTTNEAILTIACWEMKLDDFLLHEYDVNSILERNYAMHLMMELTQEKCRGITDVLLLEPWGCFDFLELHRLEPPVLFVGLDVLACQIFEAMDQLIEWKGLELHKSMKSATFPLRSGVFGNCTEEVIEVVGHADCARRSEGHRFIGSHHLLLGLLRTRIRRSVLKFVQLRQALEEPVRNPRYRIYGTAECLAGVDKIQLEHLFLAIMFLELGRNFFSLEGEIIKIFFERIRNLGNLCSLKGLKCDLQKLCMLEELEIDLGKELRVWRMDELMFPGVELVKDCPSSPGRSTKHRDDNLGQSGQTVTEKGIPEAMLEKIAKVASQEEERKDFLRNSMFSSLKDRGGEDRVFTAAKGAAFLAHNSFSCISWTRVEDEVFSEDPDALTRAVGVEDFIRIAYEEELNAEHNKFMFDLFRLHKTTNEAILAIAHWEMKLDDFILLHEYDVNSILETAAVTYSGIIYPQKNVLVQQQPTPPDLLIHKDVRMFELLIQCTMIVMKQFRPLKRNYAMHLMMELTQKKCRGITDVLLLEPWGCFDFLELRRLEPPVKFVGLDVLACQIFEAMDQLIEWKGLELHKSMKSATFPLRSGVFGNCTEEVIEVVGHDDCARRSEGHRFIGSHHLLLGLLRTRIRGSVLKFVQLRQALEEPARNPRYRIYGTAQCLAGVDKIQLEHLFLAIMFLELGRNFFSLGDEIIAIIEQEDLSMDERICKLLHLCSLEGLKCDLRKEDLSINEPILKLGKLCVLEELEIDLGKQGLLKLIRRQAGKT
ncbi:unnamed protein product [Camellia sinensis]